MYSKINWCAVVPMANEEPDFGEFTAAFRRTLDTLGSGTVYLVIDAVSQDKTYTLCEQLALQDRRFHAVWAPENRNVVDAYLGGFAEAAKAGHDLIIEMDAGLSHDPNAIPMFLRVLNEGNECAFGSRYINGGSMADSPWKRRFFSKGGTLLANFLLGTRFADMTSGYQGFHRSVVERLLAYPLKSKAHFYQTEVRYLLRHARAIEVPIHYRAPSPSVSKNAVRNSFAVLFYYFLKRVSGHAPRI